MDNLDSWIGKQEVVDDIISVRIVNELAATLNVEAPSMHLPHLWHWTYCHALAPTSSLKEDGHMQLGQFLPKVDLPRRMWAGSRVEFIKPLTIGEAVTRNSVIKNIVSKTGKTGNLVFVTVAHTYLGEKGGEIYEEQDIVYKEESKSSAINKGVEAPLDSDWQVSRTLNSTFLFRYSAVTFNSHRIHYDKDYAVNKENYQNLVVHGPLLATLLMEQTLKVYHDMQLKNFNFRIISPIFVDSTLYLHGKRDGNDLELWITNDKGILALKANAIMQ